MNRQKAGVVVVLALALSLGAAHAAPGVLNVLDFGATGGGIVDDSGAIQNALDAASAAGGGVVTLPPGDYLLESSLTVASGVTLQGVTRNASTAGVDGSASRLLGKTSSGLVVLESEAGLEGVSIFYPEHTGTVTTTPAIKCSGSSTVIRWVHLVNPYVGVAYHTDTAGHLVRGLNGQPLNMGILNFPGGRLEGVKFVGNTGNGAMGEAGIHVAGPHTAEIIDCAISGFQAAIVLTNNFDVLMTNVTASSADYAVYASSSSTRGRAFITNGIFEGKVDVDTLCKGDLTFTGCHFEPNVNQTYAAHLQGAGAVTFKACHFAPWDSSATGGAAIDVDPEVAGGAPLIVTSCVFDSPRDGAVHVRLSPNVREATIGANVMTGAVSIENNAPDHASVVIANNAVRAVQ